VGKGVVINLYHGLQFACESLLQPYGRIIVSTILQGKRYNRGIILLTACYKTWASFCSCSLLLRASAPVSSPVWFGLIYIRVRTKPISPAPGELAADQFAWLPPR